MAGLRTAFEDGDVEGIGIAVVVVVVVVVVVIVAVVAEAEAPAALQNLSSGLVEEDEDEDEPATAWKSEALRLSSVTRKGSFRCRSSTSFAASAMAAPQRRIAPLSS